MPLISLRQLRDHAADHSADARKDAGEPILRKLVEAAVEPYPQLPIGLHQDHGASPAVCPQAIRAGCTNVMVDGSLLEDQKAPTDCDDNTPVTQRVVEMGHAIGVSVQVALGCLGSLETGQACEEDGVGAAGTPDRSQFLTDPAQAADFVACTGMGALAIAIGTSHGGYKFSRQHTGDSLALERIAAIHAAVPNTHLVVHGSSSVPQEWLATIRESGGRSRETCGVPVDEIVRGIQHGVRETNIGTDIRLARCTRPDEFDPRAFLKAAPAAARQVCQDRSEAFGCAGQAGEINVLPLAALAQRDAKSAARADAAQRLAA